MKRRRGNCLNTTSNLEKILIAIIAVLLCFVLGLFVIFLLHQARIYKSVANSEPIVASSCSSPECIQAAAQIIGFIDPSVDPCENFYDFSCGTFLKKSIETKEFTALSKLNSLIDNRLEAFITETSESSEKPLQLQRKFYKTCMNTTAIEEDKNDALINLIVKVGEWPVRLGRLWDNQRFHWLWTMVKCRNLGVHFEYFMEFSRTEVTMNGTEFMVLSISPPKIIDIPAHFRNYYIELMTNISLELNASYSYETAKEEFIRVLNFQDQLNLFRNDQKQNGQPMVLRVETLQQDFPTIPWIDFLNNITITSLPFNSETWIDFKAERYFTNLLGLLGQTPKTTQANYVIWKLVESYSNYLNDEQRTRYNSLLKNVHSNFSVNDRKEFCLVEAKNYFPSVAEIAYVRKYVSPETRTDLKQMIAKIKGVLKDRITAADWLDDKTKKLVEIKLNEIKWMIGASDDVYEQKFEKIVNMEEFDLETNNILEMSRKLTVRSVNGYFSTINRNLSDLIRENLDKSPILQANSIYERYQIKTLVSVLFASLLQGFIYDFRRPQYMNYGAIGSIIGHKLVRDLLSNGSKDDGFISSWPTETRKLYEEKINCLGREYQNYSSKLPTYDLNVENLIYSIGSNLAYQAYLDWSHYNPRENTLPGLNYTPKQIFWIMSGAINCRLPNHDEDSIFEHEHGEKLVSVNFGVHNSPDFAVDFNCSTASKPSSKKKCQIL